jgi:hypothetical protein
MHRKAMREREGGEEIADEGSKKLIMNISA